MQSAPLFESDPQGGVSVIQHGVELLRKCDQKVRNLQFHLTSIFQSNTTIRSKLLLGYLQILAANKFHLFISFRGKNTLSVF